MDSMLASNAVIRGFEHWSFKPKTIKLVFVDSAKHTAFGVIADRLAHNQDNVSEWSDMSRSRLLFQ